MGYLGLIDLTETERDLLYMIEFDLQRNHDKWRSNCILIKQLWSSLSSRGAIRPIRWKYFSEKEYGPDNGRYSYLDSFHRSGCSDDEIITHPHFLEFLRYIIFGSELNERIRDKICALIEHLEPITSGDIIEISSLSCDLVRKSRLDPRYAGEEIFKLLIDLGVYVTSAKHVRDVVRKMKPGR